MYQDAAATEFVFPMTNAEVAFAVVEDQEQVDKLLEVRPLVSATGTHLVRRPARPAPLQRARAGQLDALIVAGQGYETANPGFFEREVAAARPDDVAAMFFTSGTTGNPKGVVHTHFSLLDRAAAGARFDKLTHDEEVLAYMPPAWIGQNIFSYAQWLACGYVVNCPESRQHGHAST